MPIFISADLGDNILEDPAQIIEAVQSSKPEVKFGGQRYFPPKGGS